LNGIIFVSLLSRLIWPLIAVQFCATAYETVLYPDVRNVHFVHVARYKMELEMAIGLYRRAGMLKKAI
jgi:hypothetical protein